MNIRKIYAALCCLLLVTMSVNAQQYMNVSGNKNSNSIPTLLVKYATLKGNKDWFKITNGSAEVKDRSISASCTVRLATNSTIKKLATSPEIGVCYSSTNTTPTISDDRQTLGKELGNYAYTLALIPGTTYYYRVYMKLGEEVFYGDVCNASTSGTRPAGN